MCYHTPSIILLLLWLLSIFCLFLDFTQKILNNNKIIFKLVESVDPRCYELQDLVGQ